MLHNNETIEVQDFGAGSKTMKTKMRKVSEIAKATLVSKKSGELLFRMVNAWQPNSILEIGTSLGISTLYLAKAHETAQVITLEGSSEIADIARKNFEKLQAGNILLIEGEFSETLPQALQLMPSPEFIFIDGNHRKTPTIQYFELCLVNSKEQTVMMFDDIHWSAEMESAWKQIISHPSVTLSVDLFFKGIIFFRKDFHQKQHFTIRF
jgi:predicted O-methyltransferase YrrM